MVRAQNRKRVIPIIINLQGVGAVSKKSLKNFVRKSGVKSMMNNFAK